MIWLPGAAWVSVVLAIIGALAIGALIWILRTPNALEYPLITVGAAVAIFVLAVVLAPFYSLLLFLALPILLVARGVYFLMRRPRPMH